MVLAKTVFNNHISFEIFKYSIYNKWNTVTIKNKSYRIAFIFYTNM
ncbi:hypothetical protein AN1V17_33700 [Vallitalea sediminicola]